MPQPRAISPSRGQEATWYDSARMLPLVVTLLVGQVDAGPADAGPGDAGAPPATCGSLSAQGACFGAAAAWCSEDNTDGAAVGADVRVQQCGAGACALVDDLGAWCFAPAGARCAFEAGERATTHACGPVQGAPDPAWGCDVIEGCVALAVAGCGEGCVDGARLRLSCASFGQPVLVSCAALGGSCAGEGCVGLAVNAPCDQRLACAADLTCVAGTCVAQVPGAAIDAGPGDPPAPPAPPPVCGAGSGAAVVALGALAAFARRRAWVRRRA